jgi:hypothetical protein
LGVPLIALPVWVTEALADAGEFKKSFVTVPFRVAVAMVNAFPKDEEYLTPASPKVSVVVELRTEI